MPINKFGLLAIPDPAKQDAAIEAFNKLASVCKKDGAAYVLSAKAAKCTVATDKPGSQPWTVVFKACFASQEDLEYCQASEDFKALREQARSLGSTGFIAVVADI